MTPRAEDEARIHRAGSAWSDLGTQRLVSGGPADWPTAVQCHRRAVGLLGELPHENPSYLADMGAAWVNLGCALQVGPSHESLGEALDAFDRAVDLLGRLPFESNSRYRHNLAAAWMNRADAFSQVGTATGHTRALRAYGRAIEIAGDLPLDEKPSFRVLLASCWINMGSLQQRLLRIHEAVHAYDGALGALGGLPASGHRLASHHAATAWTNRGEALLSATTPQRARQAVESARAALTHVEGRDLDGPVDAKLSLRALRVMARGLEHLMRTEDVRGADGIAELTEVAERGLDLAFGGHEGDPQFFDPFIVWFFSFASRVYGRHQPQFLAEFLDEALHRWGSSGNLKVGLDLLAIAGQARSAALEGLGRNRLLLSGTRQTELILKTVDELRSAEFQF